MFAPVPFVSVSSTQTFPNAPSRVAGRMPEDARDLLGRSETERFVQAERVVAGIGGDHEPVGTVQAGGPVGSLDDEPRADPLATMRGRRVDDLEAAAAAGHHDAAAPEDLAVVRLSRHVPGAASGAEQRASVRQAPAAKVPMRLLVEVAITRGDLELDDLIPEIAVAVRVERVDEHLAVRARWARKLPGVATSPTLSSTL